MSTNRAKIRSKQPRLHHRASKFLFISEEHALGPPPLEPDQTKNHSDRPVVKQNRSKVEPAIKYVGIE